MNKISAIVIAKNEENMIADCLDSLSFCDEILVVDGGSEDRTTQVCERMGAKVSKLESEDFSKLRNFGKEKALYDWLFYVDADERVTPELVSSIKYQVSSIRNEMGAFKIRRKNFYFGSAKQNEWPYVERLERLFKRNKLEGWYGKLHESPKFKGEIGELEGFLLHYTHRDLTSMLKKTIEWSRIEAELRLKGGHPKMTWWRFPRVMISAFLDSYIRQGGWKVGAVGLIESTYQAFSIFITYARLWELQRKNDRLKR